MGIAKKINLNNIFVFLFFILFPFGQIIRFGKVHPLDVIAGAAALAAVFGRFKKPEIFRYFDNFLLLAFASWFFSLFIFKSSIVLYGTLYLLRLFAYFYFFIYVWNFARQKENKRLLLDSLLIVSLVSAFFGWIQFFWIPDIKPFFAWGWDEHLFRLVGTFLDPTFLGIIIVFGLIITIYRYIVIKEKGHFFTTLFLLISLMFTYSRASYLAFIAEIIFLGIHLKKTKVVVFVILGIILAALMLPTTRNHSISLFRQFSAIARVENYKETIKIFRTSPIFGVGYNNLCLARNKFIGIASFDSHACSGSDASLLTVLATTGVLGLFVFLGMVYKLWRDGDLLLKSSLIALAVHSLFANSIFYSWVMGWLAILLAVSIQKSQKNSTI